MGQRAVAVFGIGPATGNFEVISTGSAFDEQA
jgi:hypothetical protein